MSRFLRSMLAVLLVCLFGTVATPLVAYAAVTPNNLPGEGGLSWSDCVYDSPAPPSSTVVVSYPYGIKLTCASVVHIRAGHGFDNYTEACISNALNHVYYKETSNSNSANWVYSALYFAGGNEYGQYYQAFVVVDKISGVIQTAYTTTNTYAGNDSWYTCARIAF